MKINNEIKFIDMKRYLIWNVLMPQAWNILLSSILGALSAICNLFLLSKINYFFTHDTEYYTAVVFFSIILLGCVSGFLSEYFISLASEKTAILLREDFCDRVLQSPLPYIENVGNTTLYNIAQADISIIQSWLRTIPILIYDVITVVGGIIWLSFISVSSSLILLFFLCFGVSIYLVFNKISEQYYTQSFFYNNEFFKVINGILNGIKELKLNKLRAVYFKILRFTPSARKSLDANMKSLNLMAAITQWGRFLFFTLIMVIYLTQSDSQADREVFSAFAMMIIFLMGPVGSILSTLVDISGVSSSLKRILSFNEISDPSFIGNECRDELIIFNAITIREIKFSYNSQGQPPYAIGPISVSFKEGELNFIVGANGSGKSTFLKVLAGLYTPDSGDIFYSNSLGDLIDFNLVHNDSVSAIFQDFHLFEDLPLWDEQPHSLEYAVELINDLGLGGKVYISNGSFNTLSLSYGQKKRLALIQSILEDRKVYIFDEWAADQDPVYKDYFYMTILPSLVKKNKIIILTTHDDKYFNCADHLLKFDSGLISMIPGRYEANV